MNKCKTICLALLVMLLWGTLFPMVKLGYTAYHITTTGDILFFAGVRFTICGIVICLYSWITAKDSYKAVKSSIVPVLLSGFFAIILHYGFTYIGLQLTDSAKTAILKQIGVLFYVCFSALFFKEDKLTLRKLLAVVMGLIGILAINTSYDGISFHFGDLLIVAASFCTVFSNIISKKVLSAVVPVTMTGVSQLFGGVGLLVFGKLLGGGMHMNFTFGQSFLMIYICLASIFSYCIWFTVVKNGELSKLFIIKFAEPVFACVFGALLLGENIFKIQYLAAFLLIAGGICISNIKTDKSCV